MAEQHKNIPAVFEASSLDWDDRVTLALQQLYRQAGFRRYRMDKFESYDFYRENQGFLRSNQVITFTDPNGRLMALKPDVTLSIVKSIPADAEPQKVFYIENVFRMDPNSNEFGEIAQVGVECIGSQKGYDRARTEAELVQLALASLDVIGSPSLLLVCNTNLLQGLLDACAADGDQRNALCEALLARNMNAFDAILTQGLATDEVRQAASQMVRCSGPLPQALEQLSSSPLAGVCREGLEQLRALSDLLADDPEVDTDRVVLDLSLASPTDYYRGLEFQGFVQGLPRAVLSGGRYDGLMERFEKPQGAVGFAVYLGEIARAFINEEV